MTASGIVKLEVCVDSIESAIQAIDGGASRIETCGPLDVGGVTPSLGLIKQIDKIIFEKKNKNVVQRIMIRPRPGDFNYSEIEKELIIEDLILLFENMKTYGLKSVDGFVFGATTSDRKIDDEICSKIKSLRNEWQIKLNRRIGWSFHRAFDVLDKRDTQLNLKKMNKNGYDIDTILTSGRAQNVNIGMTDLQVLIPLGVAQGIMVMCGGGVVASNVNQLVKYHPSDDNLKTIWVHSSGSKKIYTEMQPSEYAAGDEAFNTWKQCDSSAVSELLAAARK